jgi:hypothetical protein
MMKTPAMMTALLFASVLGLQAQSYTSPSSSSSSQQSDEQRRKEQQSQSSTSASQSNPSTQNSSTSGSASQSDQDKKDPQSGSRYSINNPSEKNQSSQSDELKYRSNQPAEVQKNDQQASTSASQTNSTQTGVQATGQTGTQASTQTDVAVSGEVETQVRTVVQQIDAQGPVVVERISTQFADATCTQENARALVEALHGGTSVTLRNEDGQTATFTPTVHLGYGDAYIALAVAVQALHDAGITGCASPAQWQAVLLGGELAGPSVRTTSVTTTERFPGVLVLHSQGGWTKVAQTTHVQFNQVVSQANSSLQINNSSSTAQTDSAKAGASSSSTGSNQQNLTPTGHPGGYDARAEAAKDKDKQKDDAAKAKADEKDKKDRSEQDQKKGDMNAPDTENPPKSETPPKY